MLEVTALRKEYPTPEGPLHILSGISLSLNRGDGISIMGPSGSGKSTFLYILGTLEPPTEGSVRLEGKDPFQLKESQRAAFRGEKVGFVFQDHCLLPQCSVLENVLAPTLVSTSENDYLEQAHSLINQVGLSERLHQRPSELSGGEKQRVALARALIRRPLLVLCDEPTGNLDRQSAEKVASLLTDLRQRRETILVVVTHSPELAAHFPTRFKLIDGRLQPV